MHMTSVCVKMCVRSKTKIVSKRTEINSIKTKIPIIVTIDNLSLNYFDNIRLHHQFTSTDFESENNPSYIFNLFSTHVDFFTLKYR